MTKTVLAHGVFDLLHPGHIAHLEEASRLGTRLIVSIVPDKYVRKGVGRPLFNEEQRATMLGALRYVDEVVISSTPDALPAINRFMPDVYVRGIDYKDPNHQFGPAFLKEKEMVEAYGGRVVFTEAEKLSTTALIQQTQAVANYSPAVQQYIISYPYGADETIEWIDQCARLSAYAIGEVIWDKYVYVEPEGRMTKDPAVSWRIVGTEDFPGGIMAVRHHLSAFCESARYHISPGISKTRYVWQPYGYKVFATTPDGYRVPAIDVPDKIDADLVVCVDYGHGLIPDWETAHDIYVASDFLALNVQANGLNYGLNTFNKWISSDYSVCNENELRLIFEDGESDIETLTKEFYHRQDGLVAVTRGHKGAMLYDGKRMVEVPALAPSVVDRIGAGDAFLAATAPLAKLKAPLEVLGLVGSIAAAHQVGVIGNSAPLDKEKLIKWVSSMLK